MPPATWKKSPPDLIERFAASLPVHPDLVRKPMFGYPAAFVNGNMVCGLFEDSVVVRLGKEGVAQAVAAGRGKAFEPMPGRGMAGYLLVPTPDAAQAQTLAAWLQQALDHVLTLPAKAAKAAKKTPAAARPPAAKAKAKANTRR
ncbi:MAG: TfoX/Sxy family protein [Burkholderiales bacterium]|nr:TfoX/Sxy family protein [Burkholderiales bacterium]MDE2452818.1 TfoX/Sxy family protein [Burkholderiales bacterium]